MRLAFDAFADVASEVAGEVQDGQIYLPSLDVTLSLEADDAPGTEVLSVNVVADRQGLPQPIRFTAVGFGDDVRAAGVSAAEQWFEVVFPVIHSLYANHETAEVNHGTISARHRPTGERFDWRVTTGPVRIVYSGASQPPPADDGKILRALSREITSVSVGTTAFWLDAYVAVQHDGHRVADCRLLNEYWPEASDRLREVAEDLCSCSDGFVSWRQFLFFSPAMDVRRKRRWWHLW